KLGLESPRSTREDVDALVIARRDVELALEDVDELPPLLHRFEQVRQGLEGFWIFAAKVEDDLPGVDRFGRIVESIGGEVRQLRANLGLGNVARSVLELALVDAIELDPLAFVRVDASERLDRRIVGLVEAVEDAPECARRVRDVAKPRFVHLTE